MIDSLIIHSFGVRVRLRDIVTDHSKLARKSGRGKLGGMTDRVDLNPRKPTTRAADAEFPSVFCVFLMKKMQQTTPRIPESKRKP